MMKNLLTSIVLCLTMLHVQAQPNIEWQKVFGGTYHDEAYSIQQTKDGGYIVAGPTSSTNGDVTGNHGGTDYWVLKLTSNGTVSWKKCFGGTKNDVAITVQQTTDGGYIVGGYSSSNDGDASGNNGGSDIWIVKLTSKGNMDWQKMLGGTNDDWFGSLRQTADGGYIVFGSTESNNGDVSKNYGSADFWLIKLKDTGEISWQKTMGGSDYDQGNVVRQTADGGYIVAGYTFSNNGDFTGNHGGGDAWIAKLNSTGGIVWQKLMGGSKEDEVTNIQQTADGGFIASVSSLSANEDFSVNKGMYDSWIVKMNSTGTVEWKKNLGGSKVDIIGYLHQTTDGGYIAAGYSESEDGDLAGLHIGEYDFWIIKLSSNGTVIWQKCLGGPLADFAYEIQQTADGGFVVCGSFNFADNSIPGGHGGDDFVVVKLSTPTGLNDLELKVDFHIYPNPANNQITIKTDEKLIGSKYTILNIMGQTVLSGKINSDNTLLEVGDLPGGTYLVQIQSEGGSSVLQLIKE